MSGDLLLRVNKRASKHVDPSSVTMLELALSQMRHSDQSPDTARGEQRRYSELVGTALVNGVPITLDARAVYEMRGND